MKNTNNKILIFYHFQLENTPELNVTSLPKTDRQLTIKDVVMALPIDLSQGMYHFRFKSEMTDGNDKMLAWIDINNLGAKVPQINGAIHVKILKFKESYQNKLFHIEKLKKAEIVKHNSLSSHHSSNNHHQIHSAPKNTSPHQNISQNTNPRGQPTPGNSRQPPPPPPNKQPATSHSNNYPSSPTYTPTTAPAKPKEPAKVPPSQSPTPKPSMQSFISFDPINQSSKPKVIPATSDEKLQIFQNQFKEEEQNRQNERIAHLQLQESLKKWGYTDMKKINNTTTLIATLHTIWPEWEPVSLTDMLTQEKVNSFFKKAVIKVHPDKNRHRHFREKYLSKRIFQLLNESRKH